MCVYEVKSVSLCGMQTWKNMLKENKRKGEQMVTGKGSVEEEMEDRLPSLFLVFGGKI